MPRRSSNKRPRDVNQLAKSLVDEATGQAPPEPERSPESEAAAMLGRKGGAKGGRARAKKLTPEQRSEIAKKAAKARWSKG
jgi:hypothetical protein